MQMRILVVLVLAVALPWASAESEERGFKSYFKGVVRQELTEEEVRGLGTLFKKALPHIIKGAKTALPYVMSGIATIINGREEELERGFKSYFKYVVKRELTEEEVRGLGTLFKKALPHVISFAKKAAPYVMSGIATVINNGRDEVEERSFKSFLKKAVGVVGKVAPLAIGAATLLGREEEEERTFKTFITKVGNVLKKVVPAVLQEGSKFLINRANAKGREEEERSVKSFFKKVGNVLKVVAPAVLVEGSKFLINRANAKGREEEEERSVKSFFKKVGKVLKVVAPAVLVEGSKFLINRANAKGREEELERGFKSYFKGVVREELTEEEVRGLGTLFKKALPHVISFAKKAAPYVMSGIATIINNGRDEEEERTFKTFITKVGNVLKKVVPAVLQEGSKFLINRANAKGREEELERGFKSYFKGVVREELTEEEVRGLGTLFKKALPHVISFAKKAAPYVMSGIATIINNGRDEEEERSFKSFLRGAKNLALGAVSSLIGREQEERKLKVFSLKDFEARPKLLIGRDEEEERSFKSFLKKAAGVAVSLAGPAVTLGTKIFGREEEEQRSFKSFLKKAAGVALKVAPLAVGAATLVGRENEEERSFKSFFKKAIGVVAKVAPLAIGAATLIGREE